MATSPAIAPGSPGAVGAEPLVRAQVGLWGDAWRRLRRNRLALLAAIYLLLLIGVALLAIVYTPYSISHTGVGETHCPSSTSHLLGLDNLGRDILSRLMVGAQISLIVGIGTQIVVLAAGGPPGLTAGYFRGCADN